jgi:polar amino acid transport system substrate-binding protein
MKAARIFLFISMLLSLLSCEESFNNEAKNLKIICEELKPYSYTEDGVQKGISIDIVQNILETQGLDNPIKITTEWEGSVEELKNNDNVVLFTTALTKERKEQFKWAGPITLFTAGFVSLEGSSILVSTVDDAKKLGSVGVMTGYSTAEMLENEGFQNLTYYLDSRGF